MLICGKRPEFYAEVLRVRPVASNAEWVEWDNFIRVPPQMMEAAKLILIYQGPDAAIAFARAVREKYGKC